MFFVTFYHNAKPHSPCNTLLSGIISDATECIDPKGYRTQGEAARAASKALCAAIYGRPMSEMSMAWTEIKRSITAANEPVSVSRHSHSHTPPTPRTSTVKSEDDSLGINSSGTREGMREGALEASARRIAEGLKK